MTNAQPHTCSLKTNHVFFPINDLSHFFLGLIFFFFLLLGLYPSLILLLILLLLL